MLRFFCCCSKDAEKPEKNVAKKPEETKQESFYEEGLTPEEKINNYEILAKRLTTDSDYALQQTKLNFFNMDPKLQGLVAHKLAAERRINELSADPKLAKQVTKTKNEIPVTLQRNRANCFIRT